MSLFNAARARSFWLLMLAELVSMAGYIDLKISLALYLKLNHYPSVSAYAIAASSLSLFALATLAWGYLSQAMPSKKGLMLVGTALVAGGYACVMQRTLSWVELGVACFVVGGALAAINMKLVVNEHFDEVVERQKGNSILQWVMNLGSFFGVLALSFVPQTASLHTIYQISALVMVLCCLIFVVGLPIIFSHPSANNHLLGWLKFSSCLVVMLLLVFGLVHFSGFNRLLVVLVFALATFRIIILARSKKTKSYFAFLVMVLIGGGGYWLAVAIFQTSFPVFLHQDVSSRLFGLHVSPLLVLLVDPVANMLIGFGLLWLYKRWMPSAFILLLASMVCNLLAFTMLTLSTWLSGVHQVAFVWPMLSVFFYAGSEFLLITTLVTQVAHLIDYKWRGFFLGYNRIAGAFYIVLIFYFIQWTSQPGVSLAASKQSNAHLFLLMLVVLSLFFIVFIAMRRLVRQ